jgi:hypothetical protein
MATWKKIVVSGSDISQLNNDANYVVNSGVDGVQLTGGFSGSFTGSGVFSGDASLATVDGQTLTSFSSSVETRISASEAFSASLDATFATDAELTAVSESIINTLNSQTDDGGTFGTSSLSVTSITGSLIVTGSTTIIDGGTVYQQEGDTYITHAGATGDLYISSSNGDTIIENITFSGDNIDSAGDINMEGDQYFDGTGNQYITKATAGDLYISASSGNTIIENVKVEGDNIHVPGDIYSTGSITFETSGDTNITKNTAGDLNVSSTNGNTVIENTTFNGNNVVIPGDLTVQGTTFEAQVTNLNVEDRYILLNSGSSATGDSGLVFGGSNGVAQNGAGLVWDASYNGNDGRLSVVGDMNAAAAGDVTPTYHIAGVFEGTDTDAATAQADHSGNIRVEGGDIFIYS